MSVAPDIPRRKHKVAIMNAVHDLPVLVARDEGFFVDEGLDLDFVTTPGMAQVTTMHEVTFESALTTDQVLALLRHTITDIEVTRRFGGAA